MISLQRLWCFFMRTEFNLEPIRKVFTYYDFHKMQYEKPERIPELLQLQNKNFYYEYFLLL